MKIPTTIQLYGDPNWRGECASETVEQATFFNRLRAQYPKTYGAVALHIKNEGKRSFQQHNKMKAEGGFIAGASDIIIPGAPTFVCELKRKDHTKSAWQKGQVEYLEAAQSLGAFVCLALGHDGAWEAFQKWVSTTR